MAGDPERLIFRVHADIKSLQQARVKNPSWAGMFLLSSAALLVHGYHPTVEDAEIYLPGIKKLLDPELYPRNAEFFATHASRTFFPDLIAASVRLSHVPLNYALLLWHFLTILLLLFACWRIGFLCFGDELAAWGGAALVAALLTIPVAGTALYIMDQYLCTRSLSAFTILFALIGAIERKYRRAAIWLALTALVHPLMVVFGVGYILCMIAIRETRLSTSSVALAVAPMAWVPAVSASYTESLDLHPYFFLNRWCWYEVLGAVAPLGIFWAYRIIARRRGLPQLGLLSAATVAFGACALVLALVITVPARFAGLALLQPLRALHLIYILMFLIAGGLLAQHILKRHIWRWLLLFVPLCGGMFYAQRNLFPATPHLEWPGLISNNNWLRACSWIRDNTPKDAFFALDPRHMAMAEVDEHGFRATADRSRMADLVKDSGSVSMFPGIADDWHRQVSALDHWREFRSPDFQRLNAEWGVNWVLVAISQSRGLNCPYTNAALAVCRLD